MIPSGERAFLALGGKLRQKGAMRLLHVLLAATLTLSSACARELGEPLRNPAPIRLEAGGTETCLLRFEGRAITGDELERLARGWTRRAVQIAMPATTAYRCVGGVIFTLQRAGIQPSFAAEPASPNPR